MNKVKKLIYKAGIKVIYRVVLLYYTLRKDNVPVRVKAAIIGAVGYLLSPVDAIADFVPIIGLTDDLGVFVVALTILSFYVDDAVKAKARDRLQKWFGNAADK